MLIYTIYICKKINNNIGAVSAVGFGPFDATQKCFHYIDLARKSRAAPWRMEWNGTKRAEHSALAQWRNVNIRVKQFRRDYELWSVTFYYNNFQLWIVYLHSIYLIK